MVLYLLVALYWVALLWHYSMVVVPDPLVYLALVAVEKYLLVEVGLLIAAVVDLDW